MLILLLLSLARDQIEYAIGSLLQHSAPIIEIGSCSLGGAFTSFVCAGRELSHFLTGMKSRSAMSGSATQQLNFYRLRHTFMFDGRLHLSRPAFLNCHMLHTIQPDCSCISMGVHTFKASCCCNGTLCSSPVKSHFEFWPHWMQSQRCEPVILLFHLLIKP